jgi:small subunit ribosomal protein S3
MAQKINPIIHRIPTTQTWRSRWFASNSKLYKKLLQQDIEIRKMFKSKLPDAGIEKIEIERSPDQLIITVHTSKPGVVIGRGGLGAETIKKDIKTKYLKAEKINLQINIKEVNQPQLSASIMAQNMAQDLLKRIPYRRTMKRALDQIMKAGAKGAKIELKGRLDGAEIARKERLQSGNVPLQTFRADIDYSRTAAFTTYGAVGIKVWVYKGEVFEKKDNNST